MQTRMSFVKKKQFSDLWAKLNVPEKTIFVWKKEKHLEIFLYALKIVRFLPGKKINLFFVSCRNCKQACHFLSTTLHTLAWMTLEIFLQIKFLSNNFCFFSRIKKLFQSYSDFFFSHLAIWPWSEITTLTSHLSHSLSKTYAVKLGYNNNGNNNHGYTSNCFNNNLLLK